MKDPSDTVKLRHWNWLLVAVENGNSRYDGGTRQVLCVKGSDESLWISSTMGMLNWVERTGDMG